MIPEILHMMSIEREFRNKNPQEYWRLHREMRSKGKQRRPTAFIIEEIRRAINMGKRIIGTWSRGFMQRNS